MTTEHDDLMNPPETGTQKRYFGQITNVDDYDCVLRKGQGAMPFDPTQHDPTEKRIKIVLELACQDKTGQPYLLTQNDINTGSKWRKTVESLKPLGVMTREAVRQLKFRWVAIERVATNRTYTATKGDKAGQEIQELAWVFVALYDSEAVCLEAERTFYTPRNGASPASPAPPSNPAVVSAAVKQTLVNSLPILWQAAGGDTTQFFAMLASNPQFAANGLDANAPEVTTITGAPPF